jgi:hypothetical protein
MYPVAVILQYNRQKTQNNTYTLKIIHNTKITNTITQNYKHNAQKETGVSSNMIKEISICTIILIRSNIILIITVHSTHCSPALLLHCTTLNDTSFTINFTLFHFTFHLVFIPFNFSTTSLHFTSPHFTSLHFTSLHFDTLHFTSLLPDFRHTSITFTSPRL